jgi:SOS response regulatory protein OraA/RecX
MMQNESLERTARDMALQLLARRDHTERELTSKLRRKLSIRPRDSDSHVSAPLKNTIEWLKAYGYLDDARFALSYARRNRVDRKHGDARIRRDLKRKGIGGKICDFALAQIPDANVALVEALAANVTGRAAPETRSELNRLYARLVRLGHKPSDVRQQLSPLFTKLRQERKAPKRAIDVRSQRTKRSSRTVVQAGKQPGRGSRSRATRHL